MSPARTNVGILLVQLGTPDAPRYFALFRRWFVFGIPGFGSVMIILWLMIAKPF